VLAGAVLAVALLAPGASAAGKSGGEALVVSSPGSSDRLGSGGSQTPFSFRLPVGAACAGDSARDGYRMQTFLVPASADPATLRYRSNGPEGQGRYPLYDIFTSRVTNRFTARAEKPGDPGLLVNLPKFDFAVFQDGVLAPGRYHIGVACTRADAGSGFNETATYWATDVAITKDVNDKPAQLHWRLVRQPPKDGTSLPLVVLGVLAGVAVAVVVARRRAVPVSEDTRVEVTTG
jgi:hypothetical protein